MTQLAPGSRLGPYEVVAFLGAGGMGEVYRARDTRLARTVAIKVLPAAAAFDSVRRARFEREAKAISSLQHPHICALHDVGETDGRVFLVMEYLDGETLQSRLQKGPLPLEQVLEVGIELADALARAHREGVIHRDLKPANVMLTRSGAKLLDFGLAKGLGVRDDTAPLGVVATGPADPKLESTGPLELTSADMVVGTLPYMAPEQLGTGPVDHRVDIWALGCVLFEMATGRRAVPAYTVAELRASILAGEAPRLADAKPGSPPALDNLIRVCLARDPELRWQSAADVARELSWILEGSSSRGAARGLPGRSRRGVVPWTVAAACAALALVGLAGWWRAQHAPRPLLAVAALPPQGTLLPALGGGLAVSPDGTRIAFAARDASGVTRLFVRALDSATPQVVAGTEGASQPFWSPDGRALGFHASGLVQRVALAGGPPETVMPAPFLFGASWGRDGVVLASTQLRGPLSWASPDTLSPHEATSVDGARGERLHRSPYFLPDGRRFLFSVVRVDPQTSRLETEIWVQTLGSPERRRLTRAESNAIYAPPGYLLFCLDGALMAQRFDAAGPQLLGEPIAIARGVMWDGNRGTGLFAAGGDLLAYAPGGTVGLARLALLDRTGQERAVLADGEDFWTPRVAPDGRHVAVERIDRQSGNRDVYVYEAPGARPPLRLTFDPGDDYTPVWSPDGRRLAYSSLRGTTWSVRVREVWGGGTELAVPWSDPGFPSDWSARGICMIRFAENSTADIVLVDAASGRASALVATAANERDGVFSPGGRYLAYVSWSSARPEVFVQSLDGGSARWQISTGGGRQPRWSRDGRELYFVSLRGRLVAVPTGGRGGFQPGTPRELFELRLRRTEIAQYDVTPDGGFVANLEVGEESYPAVSLVLGWARALR